MLKQEQNRLLKGLLKHLDAKTNVDAGGIMKTPAETYTSEDRFETEWKTFFQDHPQIIGMSGDLAEANSFFTVNDFGSSIIATRDPAGKFKAYANVCSHRGAEIEQEKRGVKSKFSCPFHGWTFNNQGSLVGYPQSKQFGEIDKDCYGLTELPCIEKYGFLWVHPNSKSEISLKELLGDKLEEEFSAWDFDKLIFSNEEEYQTDMNWKLAIDTFGETYHFSVLHKDSLFQSFHGNCQMFDSFKKNGRLILCKRDIDEMRKLPEKDWKICTGTLPVYYLFPNIIFMPTSEGAFLVREYPLENSPHKSVSKISFYFYPEALEAANKMGVSPETGLNPLEELYSAFGSVIRDEDYVVAASSHKGLKSGNLDFLTFGRNEPALHHYHNTYREALGLQKLPLI
jgi:phenylpropionate dioxygenase-like ring-hydroxylating dioxygenase large terminal subunit